MKAPFIIGVFLLCSYAFAKSSTEWDLVNVLPRSNAELPAHSCLQLLESPC